jgi:hypothetical protein
MNVEAAVSKGGYMLNLLERFVSAVEKFADVADRAVKLEERRQGYSKTYLHDHPKHPAHPNRTQPHSAGGAPKG